MKELNYNSASLTQYWLGDLPQAEQDRLEENYFCENDLFVELLDAKDQLIADYLNDRLARGERERFERRFLTLAERRHEVEWAAFFRPSNPGPQLIAPPVQSDRKPSWWQLLIQALHPRQPLAGLAAGMLLIAAGIGIWSARRAKPDEVPIAVAPSRPMISEGPAVVALTLKPGVRDRNAGAHPKVVISAATRTIRLMLEVGSETYRTYQARLQTLDNPNADVLTADALKAETNAEGRRTVVWDAPNLAIDDYQVVLSGVNADHSANVIGIYSFIVREQ